MRAASRQSAKSATSTATSPATAPSTLACSAGSAPASSGTRLCADLGTDSLDRQSIAADCDMAFGIEIPDDHVAEWLTVADIAATVARLTEERVAA